MKLAKYFIGYLQEFNKSNIIQEHKYLILFIIYVDGLNVKVGGHSHTFYIQVQYAIYRESYISAHVNDIYYTHRRDVMCVAKYHRHTQVCHIY